MAEIALDAEGMFYKTFGKLIASHRRERKMTQEELADAIGVKRTTITNIENGEQRTNVHTFAAIVYALGISPIMLLPKPVSNDASVLPEELKDAPDDAQDFIGRALEDAIHTIRVRGTDVSTSEVHSWHGRQVA